MRVPVLASLAALAAFTASAGETPAAPAFPLWDGAESVEQYARRAKLPTTKTLDLGNGVKVELVLIPAGRFVMGTAEPESRWIGGAILAAGGLVALVLLAMPVTRAIRQRRRPQFSLRWLILLVAVLGVAQYGGFRWWRAAEAQKIFVGEESPAHEVTISTPFYLGRYEVTQEQYQQVTGSNPSYFKGQNLPVEQVSWDEAQEFCKKASEVARSSGSRGDPEGRPTVMRLPTEAEWEYACRAGTTTRFCSGDADADLESVAWRLANSDGQTHPVGQKKPNAWRLYDMHGNVWEWCADWYGDYRAAAATDPQGPEQGQYRVLRGACWRDPPGYFQSSNRGRLNPDARYNIMGFRVAVEVPKTP